MLNWRNYSMEKSDRKIELTKQEKRSSLEAKFWNDKQKIDKNTSLMQKIEKIFNLFLSKEENYSFKKVRLVFEWILCYSMNNDIRN